MIEESGRVVAVESDAVWVETARRTGCGRCDEPGGCGNGALARHARSRMGRVRALNPGALPVDVGDHVLVGVPEDAVLRGAALVYVLPLVLLLGGAAAGVASTGGDGDAIAGAAAGLLAGFLLVRLLARRAATDISAQPVVIRRVPAPVDAACNLN